MGSLSVELACTEPFVARFVRFVPSFLRSFASIIPSFVVRRCRRPSFFVFCPTFVVVVCIIVLYFIPSFVVVVIWWDRRRYLVDRRRCVYRSPSLVEIERCCCSSSGLLLLVIRLPGRWQCSPRERCQLFVAQNTFFFFSFSQKSVLLQYERIVSPELTLPSLPFGRRVLLKLWRGLVPSSSCRRRRHHGRAA